MALSSNSAKKSISFSSTSTAFIFSIKIERKKKKEKFQTLQLHVNVTLAPLFHPPRRPRRMAVPADNSFNTFPVAFPFQDCESSCLVKIARPVTPNTIVCRGSPAPQGRKYKKRSVTYRSTLPFECFPFNFARRNEPVAAVLLSIE